LEGSVGEKVPHIYEDLYRFMIQQQPLAFRDFSDQQVTIIWP
jgi:hypothetical protein